jgi:predicted nucleotidyltransferase
MTTVQLPIPEREIAAFCKRWKVTELSLFGSAVRDDFSTESDVDALISFSSQSEWGLFDHIQMKQELNTIFGRNVDLITRRALEQSHNELLRAEILESTQVIYSDIENTHV